MQIIMKIGRFGYILDNSSIFILCFLNMVNCVVFVLECVYMLFLGDTKCLGMKCHGVCMYSLFKCFSKKGGCVYMCDSTDMIKY